MSSSKSIAQLTEAISQAMPTLDETEQRIALALYRALAEGRPVDHSEIARRGALDPKRVDETVRSWPGVFRDDEERIVGFWGLALPEMPHRFEVGGIKIHTWCAWDPLFIAPLLGKRGRVESRDPRTGETVSLMVTPEGVEDLSPDGAVVSFLMPDEPWDHDVIQGFCHYVLFFASRESGERWVAEHPGTFLVSVDDAFEVGRRTNERQFAHALALQASPA